MKKSCETFFQEAMRGNEGEDVAPETIESLSIKFGMILEYLKEIKNSLNDLPCDDLGKDVAENAFEIKHLKAATLGTRRELDKEIYLRLRSVETTATKLTEQNKGQDAISSRTWVIIMALITVALNTLSWYLR